MMRVNVGQAKARLTELIEAALKGEEVIIAKRNVPLVKLTVVRSAKTTPRFGSLKGAIWMASDFDAPLPELAEYSK